MATIVEMPKFGLSMEEGTIASWLKEEGEVVKKGEPIGEITTEKITNTVEAPEDGILIKIVAQEDETLPCGATIAYIGEEGETISDSSEEATSSSASEVSASQTESDITYVEMPKFGLSMEEGTVATWFKAEGDSVNEGETLAEITTEKITNTVEAPANGILRKILVPEGETVACGVPIGIIASADAVLPTDIEKPEAKTVMEPEITKEEAPKEQVVVQTHKRPLDEIVITPKAEKLAKEKGVDYSYIVGTGIGGAITIKDIKNYLASGGARQTPVQSGIGPATETKMSQMRGIISDRMMASLRDSAQTTMVMDVDVTDLTKLYKLKREEFKAKNVKLSYTAILIKAVANALSKHERFRTVITENNTLLTKSEINIGIAVDIEDGLVVPVLRNVDQKDMETICNELEDLAKRARENGLSMDELSGGTMTITNLGMFGIKYFTPVLNLPESAILGVGATTEQPVVVDGGIHVKSITTLSLTHDHRIIDGAPAARFLNEIKQILQEPQTLF
ncbi:MAG TPA: 2-oxo acid dehydrogenase subunit E2 [Clostridia bacterium]|nr:2-oxo acid dehydrogenase subunit E2 [Clostridia bacterium]